MSSAATSVVPVKVVVRRRSSVLGLRANWCRACSRLRTPPTVTKAKMASMRSDVAISRDISWPSEGSAGPLVRRVEVASGVLGRSGTAPRCSARRRLAGDAGCWSRICSDRSASVSDAKCSKRRVVRRRACSTLSSPDSDDRTRRISPATWAAKTTCASASSTFEVTDCALELSIRRASSSVTRCS